MNWIDARKQQILDEHEKRKAYKDIEERALNTKEDYEKEYNKLMKEAIDAREKYFKLNSELNDLVTPLERKINDFKTRYRKLLEASSDDFHRKYDKAEDIYKEATAKGFKLKHRNKYL